jgi:SAM-dependent methyltransferase
MSYDAETPRAAFNRVGPEIEQRIVDNPIVAWMRAANRKELAGHFPTGSRLLEIGCGAGADAVHFAEGGCKVVALDISDRMIDATRERAERSGVGDSVRAFRGRLVELRDELAGDPWAPFEAAYANFSLTYEPSLAAVGSLVRSLLAAGGRFLFTVPNRLCVSEPLLAAVRGRPGSVFARLRDPRWLDIRGTPVQVHAYTVAEVRRALSDHFEIVDFRGLPAFMPPSRLYAPSLEPVRKVLERLDDRWDRSFPWRLLGETTFFDARALSRSVPGSPAAGARPPHPRPRLSSGCRRRGPTQGCSPLRRGR